MTPTPSCRVLTGPLLALDRPRGRPMAVIGVVCSVPVLTMSAATAGLVIDALAMSAVVMPAYGRRQQVRA